MKSPLTSLLMVLSLTSGLAEAQSSAPPACTAPEHRQFDFWLGDWIVQGPKGQQVGTNRIETIENGCGLQENWRAANGGTGRSLNFYRPATRMWTQAWVGTAPARW